MLTASDENPRNAALLKELDEPLTMSFAKPTPLADVLKYIKSSTVEVGPDTLADLPRSQGARRCRCEIGI